MNVVYTVFILYINNLNKDISNACFFFTDDTVVDSVLSTPFEKFYQHNFNSVQTKSHIYRSG